MAVGGAFAPDLLDEIGSQRTLVICDAEGAEAELMDPDRYLALHSVDTLIVECHEEARPGVTGRIRTLFASTHQITLIAKTLSAAELPEWLQQLSQLDQLLPCGNGAIARPPGW